jgi:hypothetical protein
MLPVALDRTLRALRLLGLQGKMGDTGEVKYSKEAHLKG